MKDKTIANATFSRFERNIQEIIGRGYKEVIEDINRTLNGVVQSTVLNAEYTKKSINLALNDIKRNLEEEEEIDRTIIQSRKLVAPNIIRKYGKSVSKIHPQEATPVRENKKSYFSLSKNSAKKTPLEGGFKLDLLQKDGSYARRIAKKDAVNGTNNRDKTYSMSRKTGKKSKLIDVYKIDYANNDNGNKTSLVCKLETLAESLASNSLIDDDVKKPTYNDDMISEDTVSLATTHSIDNTQESIDDTNTGTNIFDDSITEDDFCCDQCSFSTNNKQYLLEHVNVTHRNIDSFGCEQCPYTTTSTKNLMRHTDGVHSDNESLKCHDCGRKFTQKHSLKSHIKIIHLKIKSYICNDCGHSFGKKSNLDKHVARRHEKVEGEKRRRRPRYKDRSIKSNIEVLKTDY